MTHRINQLIIIGGSIRRDPAYVTTRLDFILLVVVIFRFIWFRRVI